MTSGSWVTSNPVVETASGPLRGARSGKIAAFLGIPYGSPPIGDLRWKPPEPVRRWTDVRDATAFGPDPMQRMPARPRAAGMSEDCLHLNIWSPAAPGEDLPVMVWIFAGGFLFGSAADSNADGEVFARLGVVSVTISHRTGIFGWLAHPELATESPHGSAGNYGLLDCIEAFRWLRANIEQFGGDPSRITAFGASSGGATISLLLTSPLARGLLDQVILQSAGAFRPLATLQQASAAGLTLGDLKSLRALDAQQVLELEPKLVPAMRRLTAPRILRPICDEWVLPLDEREAYERGAFEALPAIVGSVADEGSRMIATWPVDSLGAWDRTLDENFPAMREEAATLYAARNDADARRAVADMFGDTQFQLGARELARAMGERQPRTYRYLFTRRRGGMESDPHHGGDTPYVFGHLNIPFGPTAEEVLPAPRDIEVSRAIQKAWVAFAATGNPGAVDGVAWPPASQGFLNIGDPVRVQREWREQQLDFLNCYAHQTPS